MGNRKGLVIMILGLLLMAAALYRVAENDRDEAEAARESDQILAELQAIMQETTQTVGRGENSAYSAGVGSGNPLGAETVVVTTPAPLTGDFVMPTPLATEVPIFIENPDMDMPTLTMKGNTYIGTLEIPTKNLILPIMSEWSYTNLKKAPCRYMGSAYEDNFIILAHNYQAHFGTMKDLIPGELVMFTDINGNLFRYEVVEIETLYPNETERLEGTNYAMTLFTCTIGGRSRVVVRCRRTEKNSMVPAPTAAAW